MTHGKEKNTLLSAASSHKLSTLKFQKSNYLGLSWVFQD